MLVQTQALLVGTTYKNPRSLSAMKRAATGDKVLGAAIRAARDKIDLSQKGLGARLGKTQAAVGQWETGQTMPDAASMRALTKLFGPLPIGSAPIADADAAMTYDSPPNNITFSTVPKPRPASMPDDVPVFGIAVAGHSTDFRFNGEIVDRIRRPDGIRNALNAFAIYVHGDCMSPAFEPGTPVYVNPSRAAKPGDYVIVECLGVDNDTPGDAFLKKLVRIAGSKVILEQYNPPKKDITVSMDRVKQIYRVIPWGELLGV